MVWVALQRGHLISIFEKTPLNRSFLQQVHRISFICIACFFVFCDNLGLCTESRSSPIGWVFSRFGWTVTLVRHRLRRLFSSFTTDDLY
jgi:hypothetical protein